MIQLRQNIGKTPKWWIRSLIIDVLCASFQNEIRRAIQRYWKYKFQIWLSKSLLRTEKSSEGRWFYSRWEKGRAPPKQRNPHVQRKEHRDPETSWSSAFIKQKALVTIRLRTRERTLFHARRVPNPLSFLHHVISQLSTPSSTSSSIQTISPLFAHLSICQNAIISIHFLYRYCTSTLPIIRRNFQCKHAPFINANVLCKHALLQRWFWIAT